MIVHNAIPIRTPQRTGWTVECTCGDLFSSGFRLKTWAQSAADGHMRTMIDLGGTITVEAAKRIGVPYRLVDGAAARDFVHTPHES